MVYKKIGDKIPSLSSLLLAGVLLGSSCPGKNKNEAAQPTEDVVPSVSERNQGGGKSLPAGYLEAVKAMFNLFVEEVSSIGHLKNKPLVATVSELQGNKAKEAVERLCKSFSTSHSNAYPSSLKEYLSPLGTLKFRASGGMSGIKHKFAHGTALNAIAQFFDELHGTYKEMMDLIQKGAPEVEMGELVKKLDIFFLEAKQKFVPHTTFHDSKKCTLVLGEHGAQFIRFLTDKEANGNNKQADKQFGMPGLLSESISSVWIQGVYGSDLQPSATGGKIDKSRVADMGNIQTRGAGIDGNWTVMNKGKMVNTVDPFPNVGLTHRFVPGDKSARLATGTAPNTSAPIQNNLTFAQCLFTLFKGNQKYDFINLFPDTEEANWFKLEGDDAKFQLVREAASDLVNADKFAKILGEHIDDASTGLNQLFVIPDLQEITHLILSGIDVDAQEKANSFSQANNDIEADSIENGGISHLLLQNLTGILSARQVDVGDALNMCTIYVADNQSIMNSTASIEQKICVKVLQKILDQTNSRKDSNGKCLIISVEQGSAKLLVEWIKKLVLEEVKNAVVYKDNGTYKHTKVSTKIQGCINSMSKKLAEKHGTASITYEDIKREAPGFDIGEIFKGMESDYESIKAILTAKVGPVLGIESPKGSVDYKTYFPYLELMDAHTQPLDEIRLAYVNKNTGQVVTQGG